MEHIFSVHSISPSQVLRGEGSWEKGKYLLPNLCRRPLLLGKSKETKRIRESITKELENLDLTVTNTNLHYGCCEIDLKRIEILSSKNKCDAIIATGGGKVLDAGKLIANRLNINCITIPTSAATCAGWTALSNIYSQNGAFIKDVKLNKCPNLLIFEHKFIKTAPQRTLSSGIADALAKWYESSISSGTSQDGMTQQAIQMSRVLRDQILIDGYKAYTNQRSNEWIRTIEGCGLSAGLIGGIGGSKCRSAGAHAIHNGLTQIEKANKFLHGEIVGFGILIQLRLEEKVLKNQLARQARIQLQNLLKSINIPLTISDLGLQNTSKEELLSACNFACRHDFGMENLPFPVEPDLLLSTILETSDIRNRQEIYSNNIVLGEKN